MMPDCCERSGALETLAMLYEKPPDTSPLRSRESLSIRRCKRCGQVWKIRQQYDSGCGSDDIWLQPGESYRRFTFTLEEAAQYEGGKEESQ